MYKHRRFFSLLVNSDFLYNDFCLLLYIASKTIKYGSLWEMQKVPMQVKFF